MKLHITVNLDEDARVLDVQSFLASVRFVLRGIFPGSKLRVTVDPAPKAPCVPAIRESTPPGLN